MGNSDHGTAYMNLKETRIPSELAPLTHGDVSRSAVELREVWGLTRPPALMLTQEQAIDLPGSEDAGLLFDCTLLFT